MSRRLSFIGQIMLACILTLGLTVPTAGASGYSKGASTRSSAKKKTVRVKTSSRKKGTTRRKARDNKTTAPKVPRAKKASAVKASHVIVTHDERARIHRSDAARHAFARQTGYPNGRPGPEGS